MYQALIFFNNGSVLRSSPDTRIQAQEFGRTFEDRKDVVEVHYQSVPREFGHQQFRQQIDDWQKLALRNRAGPRFDEAKDRLALGYVNAMRSVAA